MLIVKLNTWQCLNFKMLYFQSLIILLYCYNFIFINLLFKEYSLFSYVSIFNYIYDLYLVIHLFYIGIKSYAGLFFRTI